LPSTGTFRKVPDYLAQELRFPLLEQDRGNRMNPSTQSVSQDLLVNTTPTTRAASADTPDETADGFRHTFDLEIEYLEVSPDDTDLQNAILPGNTLPQDGNLLPPAEVEVETLDATELSGTAVAFSTEVAPAEMRSIEKGPVAQGSVEQGLIDGEPHPVKPLNMEITDQDPTITDDAPTIIDEARTIIDEAPTTPAVTGFVASDVERAAPETVAEKSAQTTLAPNRVAVDMREPVGSQEQKHASTDEAANVARNPTMKAMWQMQTLVNGEQPVPLTPLAQARPSQNPINLDGMQSSTGIQVRVGESGWGETMVNRITMLVGQRISSAQVHLNPPELGPVEVKVSLNQDQASVLFVSHSAQVREALSQSIPRLAEMLGQMGIDLTESDVSDQSFSQRESAGDRSPEFAESSEEHSRFDLDSSADTHRLVGIIDFYV
jgi:hypothetical protein